VDNVYMPDALIHPLPPGLPDELSDALRLLEQEGRDALSLSRVATRLGRGSDPVLAELPWPSERALRTDLAALGFHRLRQALAEAQAEGGREGHDAFGQLMAAGRAYIRAAVRSPALFALMRDSEAVDFTEPRLQAASGAAFHDLLALVVALQASGFEAERGTEDLSHVIWDSVHRITMRWADAALDGPVEPAMADEAISLELTLLLLDGEPRQQVERAS
jgi:hypothetical protein